ncbi:YciI family protein [Chitinophaga sp. YIM B06452]|uniref:YciI family protein n=1 Tax=Chitinophaga sp. YIM B06452 TaxID=3082158 RepID=UPI0031FEC90F
MKRIIPFILLMACGIAAQAQVTFNKALADSLGADQYGMKMYQLVILKTGSNTTTDKEKVNELFKGHMTNIGKLVKDGKLVVAGPLGKNDKQYRGIFILSVKTKEEAAALLETDPAIKEKLLDAEIYPWYGSAALPKYLEYHSQVEQAKPGS